MEKLLYSSNHWNKVTKLFWDEINRKLDTLSRMIQSTLPASRLFSSISLSAETGRWIISPAAILFTTSCGSRKILFGPILSTTSISSMYPQSSKLTRLIRVIARDLFYAVHHTGLQVNKEAYRHLHLAAIPNCLPSQFLTLSQTVKTNCWSFSNKMSIHNKKSIDLLESMEIADDVLWNSILRIRGWCMSLHFPPWLHKSSGLRA